MEDHRRPVYDWFKESLMTRFDKPAEGAMGAVTLPCEGRERSTPYGFFAQMVEAFQHLYNHQGPQGALAGKTPAEYLAARRANETPQSHML